MCPKKVHQRDRVGLAAQDKEKGEIQFKKKKKKKKKKKESDR
jgi:hypothetical protein